MRVAQLLTLALLCSAESVCCVGSGAEVGPEAVAAAAQTDFWISVKTAARHGEIPEGMYGAGVAGHGLAAFTIGGVFVDTVSGDVDGTSSDGVLVSNFPNTHSFSGDGGCTEGPPRAFNTMEYFADKWVSVGGFNPDNHGLTLGATQSTSC